MATNIQAGYLTVDAAKASIPGAVWTEPPTGPNGPEGSWMGRRPASDQPDTHQRAEWFRIDPVEIKG